MSKNTLPLQGKISSMQYWDAISKNEIEITYRIYTQRFASTTDVITFVLKTGHLMGQTRIRLLSLFLILFPLSGSIFSRLATDLFDVSLWPFLLMLLLSLFKIISDATMDNFVPYFVMVLVGVSWFWHIDSSFV